MNEDVTNRLNEYSGGDMASFINDYRKYLGEQRDADIAALNNQRNLDYTSIMSGANRAGMLHSSFPTISKLRYDTGTYEPNLVKINQSYQTGLDKLYENVAKYANNIRTYQQKLADLSTYGLS